MSHITKRWVVGGENYCLLQPKIPFHWEQDHTQQCPFPQSKQAVCFKNRHVTEQTLKEISTHFLIFDSSAPFIVDFLLACNLPCKLIKTLWDTGGEMVTGTDQFYHHRLQMCTPSAKHLCFLTFLCTTSQPQNFLLLFSSCILFYTN